MNVYDFDGTIYNGDSGVDFIKFALKKKKFLVVKYLLCSPLYVIKYVFKELTFSEMKEKLFSFVKKIDKLDEFTEEFAQIHKKNIKKYYLNTRKADDLVVSASLDFYLIPLCNAIGISNVICTRYDTCNGKIIGENCKGAEKVKRFEEEYGENAVIENAYGDSINDVPIIKRGLKGYVVNGDDVISFSEDYKF